MPASPQDIQNAFRKLPYPVREFVASPDIGDTVEKLGQKYNLHVDAMGVVHQALTEMLVGLINPTQFASQLRGAGIAEAQVVPIINDLNEQVFKPLQAKFKEEGTMIERESDSYKNEPVATPAPAPTPVSAPVPAPVAPAAPAVDLAGRPVPAPAAPIMVPTAPTPAPPPPAYIPPAPAPIARPAQDVPTMRTMQHDVETMKEGGGVPEPGPYRAPAQVSAPVPSPAPMPAPTQAPFVPPTPVTPPAPRPPQPVAALQQKPVTPNAEALSKTLQKYGIDPYREIPE